MDNCAYNRPFDDQSQFRVRVETEAKLVIKREIEQGRISLIWSYINESENLLNPSEESKASVFRWSEIAKITVFETENLLKNARNLVELGLKPGDALHLAAAVEGKADFFVTTDDGILRKVIEFAGVFVSNPVNAVDKLTDYDN